MTQTVAADVYDYGAAAIRFPSCLDGNPCVAIFEGRGALELAGEVLPLTDPGTCTTPRKSCKQAGSSDV